MEVAVKFLWLATLIFKASAIDLTEAEPVTTPSPIDLLNYTAEPVTELTSDNGMIVEVKEVKTHDPPTALEEEATTVEEPETVLIAFPENHKNFTPSQYLVEEEEYPAYFNHLNDYQQQYKNYYEQKQLYSGKPIKFEENSNKNFYLPQGVNTILETNKEDKPERPRVNRKPFPYVFENEKTPEDWYGQAGGGHISVHEEPEREHVVRGHQEHVLPYYVVPHSSLYDHKFYKDAVYPHEHHEMTKNEKADPWKKVFKVLTALVPLGLFLATLTPNVISINSTGTYKTTRQRSVETTPLKFKEEEVLRLLKEYGVESLSEAQCEDRVICELAKKGEDSAASSIEKGFWYLANETPWDVAEKAGMNDLFKAIKTGNCELFKCHSKSKSGKITFVKKTSKRRKSLEQPPLQRK